MRLRSGIPVCTLFAFVALLVPPSAHAVYPGANGKGLFERAGDIWTVNPDGTGAAALQTFGHRAEWSPDGARVAYDRDIRFGYNEVRIVNADGSGNVAAVGIPSFTPSWSPDGTRLAWITYYSDSDTCVCQVWEVRESDLDGTHQREVTTGELVSNELGPIENLEWSPRGNEIAFTNGRDAERTIVIANVMTGQHRSVGGAGGWPTFSLGWSPSGAKVAFIQEENGTDELYIANSDGTGMTHVTGLHPTDVEWSPDGTKLVLAEGGNLFVANTDGTAKTQITSLTGSEILPDWQPVVTGQLGPGFPRPKGASPMRLSLVPAYRSCASPNRTHGSPLAFGSCNPPAQTSSFLTVGTPDANGAPAKMIGSLRLEVMNSAAGPPQSDVRIKLGVDDVRCRPASGLQPGYCTQSNTAGGADYNGRLRGVLSLRVTDRYNLPSPGGQGAGTVTDAGVELRFVPTCANTADASIGAHCAIDTTANALYPGVVAEGRRSLWQTTNVEVFDGGAGGGGAANSIDNTLFLRQGIFVP